ncbi:MAG: hypothetical protein NZ108_06195, partial [Bacteroidia bacterium]|nr:hypothetical protein [Bacteroidia bacterium]
MNFLKKLVIFLIIAGLACGWYYNYVYKKSAQFLFLRIVKAIQEKDIETYRKHVGTETILISCFDGFIEYAKKKSNGKIDLQQELK